MSDPLYPATEESEAPNGHQKRIRQLSRWRWRILIIFALFGLAWLFFRVFYCTVGEYQAICEYSYIFPFVISLIAIKVFGSIWYELQAIGQELDVQVGDSQTHKRVSYRLKAHTKSGYRSLPLAYRAQVRHFFFVTAVVFGSILGFIFFYSGLPALADIGTVVVVVVIALALNYFWFK